MTAHSLSVQQEVSTHGALGAAVTPSLGRASTQPAARVGSVAWRRPRFSWILQTSWPQLPCQPSESANMSHSNGYDTNTHTSAWHTHTSAGADKWVDCPVWHTPNEKRVEARLMHFFSQGCKQTFFRSSFFFWSSGEMQEAHTHTPTHTHFPLI